MSISSLFRPKPTISEQDVTTGLRWYVLEGMASLGFLSITTSGFLAAFALALGANNLQIGILAAIPFLTQPLQIPAIAVVERIRRRKAIVLLTFVPAQLLWIPIALIPVFMDVPGSAAISMLLGLLAMRGILVALTNCAWNGWVRDLVPQGLLGRVTGQRLTLAGMGAMLFGLAAAFFADWWAERASDEVQALGYTFPLLFGVFTLALASPIFMALMPEPSMVLTPESRRSVLSTVATPFRDVNYRKLLRFLFLWSLAINLATPFFAVYMLQRIGLPLSAVIGFSILSQVFNVIFLRVWGRLADQFGMKAVLSVCVSLYLLVILGWTFTTMPDRYFLTLPLLAILHIMAGVAAAGVTLTTGTIGMKLAPHGQATAYLAGAGLATSLGAGLGPMLGGQFADFFSVRKLSLTFEWVDPNRFFEIGALNLTGYDFLFIITFVLGMITLAWLGSVREDGEAGRELVLESLYAPMQGYSRPFSTIASLGFLSQFPYGQLRRVPGLDVALGVTAYQIAETAKVATVATVRGKRTSEKLGKALEDGLRGLLGTGTEAPKHANHIALQVLRGSIHAVAEVAMMDVGQLSRQGALSVARALGLSKSEAKDALRGVGYGVVQGAEEVQAAVGEAAASAVEAAKELAAELGLTQEEAAREVARGAIEAAEALGGDVVDKVCDSLPDDVRCD